MDEVLALGSHHTILIIGTGQAGGQTARQLLASGFAGKIIIASDDPHPPYERPPLSKEVLKGPEAESSIWMFSQDEWRDKSIIFHATNPVVAIDTEKSVAKLASGEEVKFDACVIATGGSARTLNVQGADLCHSLRSLEDSRNLREKLGKASHIAVIGGGVIGLEVASVALSMGLNVTIVESSPRIMGRILPPIASEWLAKQYLNRGVNLVLSANLSNIQDTSNELRLSGTHSSGEPFKIGADLALSSIGLRPNSGLMPQQFHGTHGGILTDIFGRVAGLKNIFAVGDVAESWSPLYRRHIRMETWRNADRHGRAVARTLCGEPTEHDEVPWMWSDQLDHNIQVVGIYSEGSKIVQRKSLGEPGSAVFWLENDVLRGGVLIDAGRERRFLENLVRLQLQPSPASLADENIPLKSLVS